MGEMLLVAKDKRTHLVSLAGKLTPEEQKYVAEGESLGLPGRYLLSARSPWYAMERRPPSPIWAAVFGRRELRFIYNQAGVHNLTAFHCVYPKTQDVHFTKALVACLNSRMVQELVKRHRRVYGGGLAKVEPKDLLDVAVPDLRRASGAVIARLAEILDSLDADVRDSGSVRKETAEALDALVQEAARDATQLTASEHIAAPRR